jgi:DNA polymerase III alpha subunit
MHIDNYGQVTRTEKEAIELLYQNPNLSIEKIKLDNINSILRFNQSAEICGADYKVAQANIFDVSIEDYDRVNQSQWFIPDHIQNFDIDTWLYQQCQTEEEFFRVDNELALYKKLNMHKILTIAKFLVDEFRKNNIVWGVGRGSSVASYCLFLIGLHKVDSLKYNLDVTEFLK